jgi:L-lactate dehydrogenase complex protein LldF
MHPPNVSFYDRVEDALHDQQLHLALARATRRFTSLRAGALATLPESDAIRDHARRIRAHTLSRLDHYLAQFAANVEAHGGCVHWAADAAACNRIVTELVLQSGRRVVKGKSMVSEETGLNAALEAQGVTVIESDLGERIVQLVGEPPSHIIAPALHKTKEEIGRILHEHLDLPLTDLPEEMTAGVRESLRHDFLAADVGISGVNFGVASTGSIALVENEGNGRLTTSAPRMHIALMGIERLVPGPEELGVMLQILTRSATGQKLTVYTNVITGPRRSAEPDGPEALHVVLVDNGRSRVLGGELAEILYCIRCGACLNACPVYQQMGGHAYGSVYSGPIGSVLTPALDGIDPWHELPQASSLCGACREVCPVRIDIPRMLLALRRQGHERGHAPWWLKLGLPLYRVLVGQPWLFHLVVRIGALTTRLMAGPTGWIKTLPPPLAGWTQSRHFPALAARPLSVLIKERRRKTEEQ